MEKLTVIMVPAMDWQGKTHTAYRVQAAPEGRGLRHASGWTLRDAIEDFCKEYGVPGVNIKLTRPFVPQEKYLQRHGVYC